MLSDVPRGRDPRELESLQFLSQFFDPTVFAVDTIQKITQQAEQRGYGREGEERWGREGRRMGKRGDFFVCYQKGWAGGGGERGPARQDLFST